MRSRGALAAHLLTVLFWVTIDASSQHSTFAEWAAVWNGRRLNITDCKRGGLNCDKEGYFVHNFTHTGIWDDAGVPIGESMCCRPDIMHESASSLGFPEDSVAVMSVGCHIATNHDYGDMACESDSDDLVAGFVGDFASREFRRRVPKTGVLCCKPIVLMATGEAWELTSCNCRRAGDIMAMPNCDANQLLWGFDKTTTLDKHTVPASPVVCCDVCVGNKRFDLSQCEHLNSCNNNGVCIMGRCECFANRTGEDCSKWQDGFYPQVKFESSAWWLGGLGFIGAFFCLFATFWIVRRAEQEGTRTANDRGLLGLISTYINDTGSVGTADTHLTDEEGDHAAGERSGAREDGKAECTNREDAYQPLLQMSCVLCESRPVQVTLVPCGHSNLCRKCSRRLKQCPFCRKPILRRQRLFLSV